MSLPDGSGVCYTSTFIVDGYDPAQVINSADDIIGICVNMEHSFLGDLTIQLKGPNGQTVQLVEQSGGGTFLGEPIDNGYTDNNSVPGVGYDYCWINNSENGTFGEVAEGVSTLPAGNYAPAQDFSNLIGCPINGQWSITVCDNWSSDDGYIFYWSLNFLPVTDCNHFISGYVFVDLDENNILDGDDYPLPNRVVKAEPGPFYGFTDSTGLYTINIYDDLLTHYVTQQELDAPLYQGIPLNSEAQIADFFTIGFDSITNVNFINYAETVCPNLNVDVSLNGVGPCSYSYVYINYENNGSTTAYDAYVTLTTDDNFEVYWAPNIISEEGNLLTLGIGDIAPGESGTIALTLHYSCDLELVGTTTCIEAHIYPDNPCEEPAEEWDRSSVMVTGECIDNEDVCFSITNTGDLGEGDMQGTSEYRVYENDILVETGTFQLEGGDIETFCWTANGSTIRFEADQRPFHPGNSHPQETIESCGEGETDTGFVLNFPQDDADDFIEIECQEVLSSFDPNDKAVIPEGITEEHYIDSTTMLEYKIRFQNTGTAPAQNIYIYDTISENLDITTFCFMSASHNCSLDILYPRVIKWTFSNIMLPDSTNNEPESHGYVKYKIQQTPGNQHFDLITNSASIFFDFNTAVITNEVFNTIGYYNEIISNTPIIYNEESIINVYPNPASDIVYFEADTNDFSIEIFNLSGQKLLNKKSNENNKISIGTLDFANGMYFYILSNTNGIISTGKILIEK